VRFLAAILAVFILVSGIAYALSIVTTQPEVRVEKIEVLAAPVAGPLSGAIEDDVKTTKSKRPLNFDESVTYPQKFKNNDVNVTESIFNIGLDVVDKEAEPAFATIYKSVKDAADAGRAVPGGDKSLLPSASMLYWKAREFDSGVIAALDVSVVNGENDPKIGIINIVEEMFNKLDKADQARMFLAAALQLVGRKVEVFPEEVGRLNIWISQYKTGRREVYPPIDYYTWNEELMRIYDFETFLQNEIPRKQWFMAAQMAKVLHKPENQALRIKYQALVNALDLIYLPRNRFTIFDLPQNLIGDESFLEMYRKRPAWQRIIVFLPPSWRREQIHFGEMLPLGVMHGLDPMAELAQRSKIGYVSFIPYTGRPGLEQFQALALDAIVSEPRSQEGDKILFTRVYHERHFHPFYAAKRMILKDEPYAKPELFSPTDPEKLSPQFRIEPIPQFYLRSARAYNYLEKVATNVLGPESVGKVRRILPDGQRATEPLATEIQRMKQIFYGLYMISCQDLGTKSVFQATDEIDPDECQRVAGEWLAQAFDDPDFALDGRYISPGFSIRSRDPGQTEQLVMTWANLGFRLLKFRSSFAQRPQIRPEGGIWQGADPEILGTSHYIMPTIQFRAIDLLSRGGLAPKQFREICDKANQDPAKIAELILALQPPALARMSPQEAAPDPTKKEETKPGQEKPKTP
jgi:hypothetical protein